jgi:hypothetical protein
MSMAYQRRNKGPRYQSTGSIVVSGQPGVRTAAEQWNAYLKKLMTALQNKARQYVFKHKPFHGSCIECGENDTLKFYVDYDNPPQTIDLCQSHHKEYAQRRGTIYDQLVRHGLKPISWEEWKNGARPADKESKKEG